MFLKTLKEIHPCPCCGEIFFKEKFINKKYYYINGFLLDFDGENTAIVGCTDCLNQFLRTNQKYIETQTDNKEEHVIYLRPRINHSQWSLVLSTYHQLRFFIIRLSTKLTRKGKKHG